MTVQGQPWRLLVVLPAVALETAEDELEHQKAVFAWMRSWVIPAILAAPSVLGPPEFRFLPPDAVRSDDDDEMFPQ